jgi:hypothetical protein
MANRCPAKKLGNDERSDGGMSLLIKHNVIQSFPKVLAIRPQRGTSVEVPVVPVSVLRERVLAV